MRNINTSRSGLMLVENPRETLTALCTFADSEVDWKSFKLSYEKVIGRTEKPIAKGHADTHFYTLTIFKLIVPSETRRSSYRLSPITKKLCASLQDLDKREEYQKILSDLLLSNESKGKLFKDFLQFVSERRLKTEVNHRFKPIPARTLMAWLKEAGLIQEYQEYVQAIHRKKKKITQKQFWKTLKETYKEMQDTGVFGIERIYVPIGELRFNVDVKLNLNKEEFYEEFGRLLGSDYGSAIALHGAPTSVFEEEETFNYLGKVYIYLSIKE